jgi:hypothetical protein
LSCSTIAIEVVVVVGASRTTKSCRWLLFLYYWRLLFLYYYCWLGILYYCCWLGILYYCWLGGCRAISLFGIASLFTRNSRKE